MGPRLLSFSPVDRNFLIAETPQRQDDGGGLGPASEEIKRPTYSSFSKSRRPSNYTCAEGLPEGQKEGATHSK